MVGVMVQGKVKGTGTGTRTGTAIGKGKGNATKPRMCFCLRCSAILPAVLLVFRATGTWGASVNVVAARRHSALAAPPLTACECAALPLTRHEPFV